MRRLLCLILAITACLLPTVALVACDDGEEKQTICVDFPSATFSHDGQPKFLAIEGTLPEGVSVSYEGNGKTEVGEYTVTATFHDTTGKYILPAPMTAVLTIRDRTTGGGR